MRFSQYPKGSDLLLHSMFNNCRDTEKEIIKQFKEHFFQNTPSKHMYNCGFTVCPLLCSWNSEL
jgi:hypothetical protein